MTEPTIIPIEIHPAFDPLLNEPHAFANIYGGRFGMKSEQAHKVALLRGITESLRVCCARETMSSIKDSSHKLLEDAIYQHGMAKSQNGPYEVQEQRILRRDGEQVASEFIFVGIRENVRDQKSLKGIKLTIVEEAAKVSQDTLDVFIPTIMGREEGSQCWFIWNPELTTDPVYKFLMLNPPTGLLNINTSYLDNPWLTETARTLVEDSKRDMKRYRHIYLGEPITEVEGAIFGEELRAAEEDGRIGSVPYDRSKPVHTAWDLGFGDPTCVWFVQARDGYLCFIDYWQAADLKISDHLIELQNRGYMYGEDHLPHDAVDAIIHKNLMGIGGDKSKSIDTMMREAGRRVRITPKLLKPDTLNFGRTAFPLCRFDAVKCADGLMSLRRYAWDRTEAEEGKRKPLHDQYSHGADAFLTAAVSIKPTKYAPMPVMHGRPMPRVVDI